MRVLIVVGSRHGATAEIADRLARVLRARSLDVTVAPPEEAPPPDGYDAVVSGSAVYLGRWLKAASRYVEGHADGLDRRPVWLFSSGPLGDQDADAFLPGRLDDLVARTGALGHRVFGGRLDTSRLGVGERMVARVVHAPDGDFRTWDEVAGWAEEIADRLFDGSAR